ncbi:MAG: hypothetical protein OEV80_04450 [candidate division Zixibacteria bacterium]|nr:hypothetical protein [candidate division Zixibacteria bacterium]
MRRTHLFTAQRFVRAWLVAAVLLCAAPHTRADGDVDEVSADCCGGSCDPRAPRDPPRQSNMVLGVGSPQRLRRVQDPTQQNAGLSTSSDGSDSSRSWTSSKAPGPWLNISLLFGDVSYSGRAGDALENGAMGLTTVGFRYRRIAISYGTHVEHYQVSRGFSRRSGYPLSYLDFKSTATLLQLEYQLYDRRGLRVIPQIGLRWDKLEERHQYYDRHPNWNLNAESRARPLGAVRFDLLLDRAELHGGIHRVLTWLSFRVSVFSLDFDNPEFGSGTGVDVSLGLGVEITHWSGAL